MRTSASLRCILLALVVGSGTVASGGGLVACLVLAAENQITSPVIFSGGFDVYHLIIDNTRNAGAVTSLDLSFPGEGFLQTGGVAIKPGAELPEFFGFTVPDTFFVVPESVGTESILTAPGSTVDTSTLLQSSFTARGAALVPGGGSAVVATITLPAGAPAPVVPALLGRGVIDGQFVDFLLTPPPKPIIPEPAGALLAASAAAFGLPRRR